MSTYKDSTSYVSGCGKADEFATLQTYVEVGNARSAPLQSLLKLSVAPSSQKFFSTAPEYQSRLDNVRISPPAMTPIGITSDSDQAVAMSGEYTRLGQSYKLNSR